jgi:SAM-dependent methyltransferase
MFDFLYAFFNAVVLLFLFLWESLFFFFSLPLWRLRWLFFSHYFLTRYWTFFRKLSRSPERPLQDFIYGETPFWTARKIFLWCQLKNGDVVWDLGCGRGMFLFFYALYFKAQCVGVEISPLFVRVGKLICKKLNLTQILWVEGDFLSIDFSTLPKPNLVYVASTTFSWETIQALTRRLETLPQGTKVVSLSTRLPSKAFKEIDKKELYFSWGKATAHLQEKT